MATNSHSQKPQEILDQEKILKRVKAHPCVTIQVFNSPEAEEDGRAITCYFGAVRNGNAWEVWGADSPGPDNLDFRASFATRSEAVHAAKEWAAETQAYMDRELAATKDEEWANDSRSAVKVTGPYKFWDTTDHCREVTLRDKYAVFDFFRDHESLFRPEEWGNLYECSLRDRKGVSCWVRRSHRGEMRIEGFPQD